MKLTGKFKSHDIKEILYQAGSLVLGSLLFGAAITMFLSPSGTILGGATGVATTLNILYGVPVGIVMLIVNIPLLLIGLRVYGVKFLSKTIITVFATSLTTDLLTFLPVTLTDPLLCSIMGSLLLGAGSGIMLARGFNTGGSDLAAVMLKKKIKRMSTGSIIFLIDMFVIGGSAVATGNYAGILYSLIATYAYSFALDYVLDGNKTAKMTLIISEHYDEISNAIFAELDRGVTILHGQGWYSHNEKNVILCVVKRGEFYTFKMLVKRIDPDAFMIQTDAREVLGHGFNSIE